MFNVEFADVQGILGRRKVGGVDKIEPENARRLAHYVRQ
jgi:hypothetical protein